MPTITHYQETQRGSWIFVSRIPIAIGSRYTQKCAELVTGRARAPRGFMRLRMNTGVATFAVRFLELLWSKRASAAAVRIGQYGSRDLVAFSIAEAAGKQAGSAKEIGSR